MNSMRILILLISLYLLYYFNLKVERKIQFVSEIDYMMDNKSQARKTDIFQSIDQANVSIGRKTTCLPFTRVSPITFTWKSLAKDDLKFPSSTNFFFFLIRKQNISIDQIEWSARNKSFTIERELNGRAMHCTLTRRHRALSLLCYLYHGRGVQISVCLT